MADDGFDLDLGGVSDFDATIVGAKFEMYADFQNDPQAALQLVLQSDDMELGEQGVISGRDAQVRLGKGWEVDDDGWTVVDGGGKAKRKFHQNSHGGLLAAKILDLVPREQLAELGSGWKDAHTYIGLMFHWEQVAFQMKDRESGEVSRYSKLLPTAFLGVDMEAREDMENSGEQESEQVDKPARKPFAKATPTPAPAETLTDEQRTELLKVAGEHKEHGGFVEACLKDDVAGATEDVAVQRAIMQTGAGSVWAEAHPA